MSRGFALRARLQRDLMGYPLTAPGLGTLPPWVRTGAGGTGITLVFAGAAMIAFDAASGPSRLVDDGRSVPRVLLGPLTGHGGSTLYEPRFWSLMLVMAAGYALLACGGVLPARAVIAGIASLHALAFLAPPISSDVFSYLDYARLGVVHGISPYAHSPAFIPSDPAFAYVGRLWTHMPSAYGPLFTVASYPAALLGIAGGVVLLKIVAVASSLALTALAAASARLRGRDPGRAALLVGANPILLVFGVEGAHNDLPMMALAMLGVWLALRGRTGSGAAAALFGAAVKAPAGLVVPFMLAGAGGRRRTLGGALAAAAAILTGTLVVFGTGALGFGGILQRQQALVTPNSFPSELARLMGQADISAGERTLLHILLAAALVYLLARVWRGADWISGTGWALLAVAVSATWMLSWYLLWPLPLAIVARDRRLLAAVFLVQALYVVHRAAPLLVSA